MAESVSIITSEIVSTKDLGELCLSMGGWLVDGGVVETYGINSGDTNVWISIQQDWATEMLRDEEFDNACENILGAAPKTFIEMQRGRGSKQGRLYIYIAYAFSKKWNVVLCDTGERILSPADIEARCAAECGDLLS